MAISRSTDRFNGYVASLAIKPPCVVATNANITLSGTQTVNGVAVVSGDRVLVKDQTSSIDNGIYEVRDTEWERTPDFDGNRDITEDSVVIAAQSAGDPIMYRVTGTAPFRPGTDPITFAVYVNPGASPAAGTVDDASMRWDASAGQWQEQTNILISEDGTQFSIGNVGNGLFLDHQGGADDFASVNVGTLDTEIRVGSGSSALDVIRLNYSGGGLQMLEGPKAKSPSAGYGLLHTRSGTPNSLVFTDENDVSYHVNSYQTVDYGFDTDTTETDPGAGDMKFNNATPASVTEVYISDSGDSGQDANWILDNLQSGDLLTFTSAGDPTRYLILQVNAAPTDNTGWWTIPVTPIHTGSNLTNLTSVQMEVEWQSQASSVANGTTDGQILIWDQTVDQAWEASTNFTFSETGGGGTGTWQIEYEGTSVLRYTATDGGVLHVDDAPLRLADGKRLDLWPTGAAARPYIHGLDSPGPFIEFTSENDITMENTGVLFRYPINLSSLTSNPTDPVGQALFAKRVSGFLPVLLGIQSSDVAHPVLNYQQLVYNFSTSTTAADPNQSRMRLNNAAFASVTAMYVDDLDLTENDTGWFWGMVQVGDIITLHQDTDVTRWVRFTVDSKTDNTGWWTIGVTPLAQAGPGSFNNLSAVHIDWWPAADISSNPTFPLDVPDDDQIRFGTDQDAIFEYDSATNTMFLDCAGTTDFEVRMQGGSEISANFTQNGSVQLYYNGLAAWQTISTGMRLFEQADTADYVDFTVGADLTISSVDVGDILVTGMDLNMQDNQVIRAVLTDYAIEDPGEYTPTGTTQTLTYSDGPAFQVDLESVTGNITITLSGGPPTGTYGQIVVKVTQDSTVARTITWAGGTFEWAGGTAHTMTSTLNGWSIFTFETWDAGTTWYAAGADYS